VVRTELSSTAVVRLDRGGERQGLCSTTETDLSSLLSAHLVGDPCAGAFRLQPMGMVGICRLLGSPSYHSFDLILHDRFVMLINDLVYIGDDSSIQFAGFSFGRHFDFHLNGVTYKDRF